nr:hypothetical protein [Pleurocapsa sp. MO_226.B13]
EALKNLIPRLTLFEALKIIIKMKNSDIRSKTLKVLFKNKITIVQPLLSSYNGAINKLETLSKLLESLIPNQEKSLIGFEHLFDKTPTTPTIPEPVEIALNPHLTLSEALEKVKTIDNEKYRTEALQDLFKRLTLEEVDYAPWLQTLDVLASLSRKNFLELLPQLAPLIIHLGGNEALRETVKAVQDVSQWWK